MMRSYKWLKLAAIGVLLSATGNVQQANAETFADETVEEFQGGSNLYVPPSSADRRFRESKANSTAAHAPVRRSPITAERLLKGNLNSRRRLSSKGIEVLMEKIVSAVKGLPNAEKILSKGFSFKLRPNKLEVEMTGFYSPESLVQELSQAPALKNLAPRIHRLLKNNVSYQQSQAYMTVEQTSDDSIVIDLHRIDAVGQPGFARLYPQPAGGEKRNKAISALAKACKSKP